MDSYSDLSKEPSAMGSGEVAKEHPVMDHVVEISAKESNHPPVDAKASVTDSDLDLAAKASKVPPVVDCEPDITAKGASDLAANGASDPSERVADVATKGVNDLREGIADLVAKGANDSPVHGDEDPSMDGQLPGEGTLIHNRPGIDCLANDCIMKILQCLPIKEAVRRWHNLWMDMNSLVFCDMPPAGAGMTFQARYSGRFRDIVNGTMASLGRRYINRLLFYITNRANANPNRLAEWLLIAAWKVTGMFSLQLPALMEGDQMVLDLPCFRSAQVISLTGIRVEIRLPNAVFNDLRHLALGGVVFGELGARLGHVVSVCCPKLQVLEVSNVRGLGDLLLDTPSLIMLELTQVVELEWLVVKASKLQILHVRNCNSLAENEGTPNPEVWAPMLKVVDWQGPCPMNALFAEKVFLQSLCVRETSPGVQEHSTYSRIMRFFKYSDSLTIHLPISKDVKKHQKFMEHIQLPGTKMLEVYLTTNGHGFRGTLFHLLKKTYELRKLDIILLNCDHEDCLSSCPCTLASWRDEKILLAMPSLKEFLLKNFRATNEERDSKDGVCIFSFEENYFDMFATIITR